MHEDECPNMEDGGHCVHWYDGQACCACGAPHMDPAQAVEQGMFETEAEALAWLTSSP